MGFLRRSKKKDNRIVVRSTPIISELEQFLNSDKEMYEALHHTMFLDPRRVETSMKDAYDNAKRLEKEKNLSRARIWFDIAGGLAIYEGDVGRATEYFGNAERVSGVKYPILKSPEKAVAKAQEYYKKYIKD